VERELVLRLANLLWRLRRATTMETGLFEIQADYLREFRQGRQTQTKSQEIIYARGWVDSVDADAGRASHGITNGTEARPSSGPKSIDPATDLAHCFLRLANLPNYPVDRLAGMKQPFGARPARSCLPLMLWIAANHRTEGPVSGLAAATNRRPTRAMSADFRARPSPHCSTRRAA
jgi:hypothetical protein